MSLTQTSSTTQASSTAQASTSGTPTMTSLSSTSGFSMSQTFTTTPTPTTTSGGGGGGGGNGAGGFNSNGGIASSASLYLYTFLATLVLLLSVSAAIILRSLILRRRHRRMVEEAIRNGTWVPPSPGGTGTFGMGLGGRGGRIDLSRKPVMWEAYLGSEKEKLYSNVQGPATQTEWDWDSIQPFSASYVTATSSATSSSQRRDGSTSTLPGNATRPRFTSSPLAFSRRMVMRFLSPGSEQMPQYSMTPRSNAASAVSLPAVQESDGNVPPSKKVQVAVLIAMPHPPSDNHESTSKSPSPAPGLVASSSSTSQGVSPTPGSSAEEEQELPQLEFGIAELEVRELNHEEGPNSGIADGKDARRSSATTSVEM